MFHHSSITRSSRPHRSTMWSTNRSSRPHWPSWTAHRTHSSNRIWSSRSTHSHWRTNTTHIWWMASGTHWTRSHYTRAHYWTSVTRMAYEARMTTGTIRTWTSWSSKLGTTTGKTWMSLRWVRTAGPTSRTRSRSYTSRTGIGRSERRWTTGRSIEMWSWTSSWSTLRIISRPR